MKSQYNSDYFSQKFDFEKLTDLVIDNQHKSVVSTCPKFDGSIYYLKKISRYQFKEINLKAAMRELVAQEFFRLIIPRCPETGMVKYKENIYIFSKKVQEDLDLIKMHGNQLRKIFAETKGMTEIATVALFVGEIDLKWGNILVSKGFWTKIDGDKCFSRLLAKERGIDDANNFYYRCMTNTNINPQDLKALPYIVQYGAYNWLSSVTIGKFNSERELLPSDPTEKYSTMLKLMLLDTDMLDNFVSSYVDKTHEYHVLLQNELKINSAQLKNAITKDPEFKKFLVDLDVKYFIETFFTQLKSFRVSGDGQKIYEHLMIEKLYQIFHDLISFLNLDNIIKSGCKDISNKLAQFSITNEWLEYPQDSMDIETVYKPDGREDDDVIPPPEGFSPFPYLK